MVSLPPKMWAELFIDGAWSSITRDLRQTSQVSITRGVSSESGSTASPTACQADLDSRGYRYAPRNPSSPLYGKVGRNTPFRLGYEVGSPWGEHAGGDAYTSLFVLDNPALDVVGDFDLRIEVALDDWSHSQMLALRYVTSSGDNRSWALEIVDGVPVFLWSPDGTFEARIDQEATEAVKAYNGQRLALRVTLDIDNGAGGHELRFYTGRTVDDEDWVLLGEPITGAGTTGVHAGAGYMELGAGFSFNSLPTGGALERLKGKTFALKLYDGGTLKVDMKTAAGAPGARPGATFVDATGLTWTVGGTAVLSNRHVRMAGEVPAWPPTADLSGNDNVVSIQPTGITRRMDAGNKPADSALLRYLQASTAIEVWPLTDAEQSTAGQALRGSRAMVPSLDSGTALPRWGQGQLADWLESVVLLPEGSDGTIRGEVAEAAGAAAGWSVDFFYSGAQDMDVTIADYGDLTNADPRIGWTLALVQSLDRIELSSAAVGDTSTTAAVHATVGSPGIFDGQLHHIRLTTAVSGADALYTLYVDGVSVASGTATGYASAPVYFIRPGWFYSAVTDGIPSIGYIAYWGASNVPSAAEVWDAANGFRGERAGTRAARLGEESGYTTSVAGEESRQVRMGRQRPKKLLELFNEAARSDFGYVLDSRDRLEMIHRSNYTLWNQPPAITLDFSAGVIAAPFRPSDDDKLTRNDVTVKSIDGFISARYVDETSPMSVLAPPDGVGRYDVSYSYSLYEDDQANQTAHLILHLGTYQGVRYARITLDLANPRVFQMIDDILRADVGDKILLTNVPLDHGPDDVEVLINGYTEAAGPEAWRITFNGVPAEPWTAAVAGSDRYGILDTAGCELATALTATGTSALALTTAGKPWTTSAADPDAFPFRVRVGGEVVEVTAIDSPARDDFSAAVANGWGTADAGGLWDSNGGAASDYNVTSGRGTHTLTSVNVSRRSFLPWTLQDIDVQADIQTSALATGAALTGGLTARHTTANDLYTARLAFNTDQSITLTIRKRVGGTETVLGTHTLAATHAANTDYRLRFAASGSTLTAKAWLASAAEPARWQITVTDTSLTTDAFVCCRSLSLTGNTNVNPVIRYDNVAVTNPQVLTVTRSANGIVKAHAAGSGLRLAHPVYAAL